MTKQIPTAELEAFVAKGQATVQGTAEVTNLLLLQILIELREQNQQQPDPDPHQPAKT